MTQNTAAHDPVSKKKRVFSLLVMLCLAVLLMLPSSPGYANLDPGVGGVSGPNVEGMAPICQSLKVYDGSYSNKVVQCIKNSVRTSEVLFRTMFAELMRPAIYAAMTLAVCFFGIQCMLGIVDRVSSRGFILVFKIAIIIWSLDQFSFFVDGALNAEEEIMTIVTTNISEPGHHVYHCPDLNPSGTPTNVWERYDCVLGGILGFFKNAAVAAGDHKGILLAGLLPIISVALFSGGIGVFVFMTGLTAIVSLILSLFKSTYLYLLSITVLAFLFMLAPLMIPMILFQETQRFFEKWVQTMMAYLLQPILLAAFLTIYLTTMDSLIYMGSRSLSDAKTTLQGFFAGMPGKYAMNTPGSRAFEPGANYKEYILPSKPLVAVPLFGDNASLEGKLVGAAAYSAATIYAGVTGQHNPIDSFKTSWNSAVSFPTLAMEGDMKKKMQDLATTLITIALMGHIMMKLLPVIPQLANQMVSSVYVTNLLQGKGMPGEAQVMGAIAGLNDKLTASAPGGGLFGGGGVSSVASNPQTFITRTLPSGLTGMAQGFINPAKFMRF